jgi:hypothetical protein
MALPPLQWQESVNITGSQQFEFDAWLLVSLRLHSIEPAVTAQVLADFGFEGGFVVEGHGEGYR